MVTNSFDPSRFDDTRHEAGPPVVADRPASRLAAEMLRDLDAVVTTVTGRIRARLTSYAEDVGGIVHRDDLWWSVRTNLELILRVIAEDRDPTHEEIAARRALGVRRARQQLAVAELVQAFQIGFVEMWNLLSIAAEEAGDDAVRDLLATAGRFWAAMHEISSVVADAHHATSREALSETRRKAMAFLLLLTGLPAREEVAREEAQSLGLDPWGPMQALVRAPRPGDDLLRYQERGVLLVERPDTVVLLQNPSDTGLGPLGAEPGPRGIGLVREGLTGARDTVQDASRAYQAARALGRSCVRAGDDWFACLVGPHAEQLTPLVAAAVELLDADLRLRETVTAFLDADCRLSATGEAIHVHANTVGYRLDRFADRTGVDPRTQEGAMRARMALLIANRPA